MGKNEIIACFVFGVYFTERAVDTLKTVSDPIQDDRYELADARIDSLENKVVKELDRNSERINERLSNQSNWIKENFKNIKLGKIDSIKASEVSNEDLKRIADSLNTVSSGLTED